MRPSGCRQFISRETGPGLDEPFCVDGHTPAQPPGVRHRAGHHEHMADRMRFGRATPIIAQSDLLEPPLALELDDLRTGVENDRRVLLNPPYQVPRHRLGKTFSSNHYVNPSR